MRRRVGAGRTGPDQGRRRKLSSRRRRPPESNHRETERLGRRLGVSGERRGGQRQCGRRTPPSAGRWSRAGGRRPVVSGRWSWVGGWRGRPGHLANGAHPSSDDAGPAPLRPRSRPIAPSQPWPPCRNPEVKPSAAASTSTAHHRHRRGAAPRAVRRHLAGYRLRAALRGRTSPARRRGKYLWAAGRRGCPARPPGAERPLVVGDAGTSRVRARPGRFTFTDQGLTCVSPTSGRSATGLGPEAAELPPLIAHIAPDPFEPAFDDKVFIARLRARRTGLKRALLDQSLVSGIGNIYADEALWRAQLHWARATETLSRGEAVRVLAAVREVLADALRAGGTSFDTLYVNVNGESGYFSRSLCVYGQEGEPCPRCGTPVRRDPFMNRSAYSCPRCQPRPRSRRYHGDLHDRST